MTDLPPCKLCGGELIARTSHYIHPLSGCMMSHVIVLKGRESEWTALMSTDTGRLDAGRKVMEAAVAIAQRDSETVRGLSRREKKARHHEEASVLAQVAVYLEAQAAALRALDLPTILGIKAPEIKP